MRSPFATRVRVDSPCGCESHPFRTRRERDEAKPCSESGTAQRSRPCRDGREVKTPGPQPGGRGSSPRRGTHTSNIGARWSSGKTSGCYPEGGGSIPSLAAHDHVSLRGVMSSANDTRSLEKVQRSVAEEFRRVAANHETRVRIPPGRPSQQRNPWSSSNGEDAGAPHR